MDLPILKRGDNSFTVRKLQMGLAVMTYHPGPIDGYYGPDTERAVSILQSSAMVLADGIAGPVTLLEYNKLLEDAAERMGDSNVLSYMIPLDFDEYDPMEPDRGRERKFLWTRIDDPPHPHRGSNTVVLNRAATEDFKSLLKAVRDHGGAMTSQHGGKRTLGTKGSPYRSQCSFHYLGRAFDLHPYSGMQDIHTDDFLIARSDRLSDRSWRVWGRSLDGAVPDVTLQAWTCIYPENRRGKGYTQIYPTEITGPFYDFTALAKKFGFKPVDANIHFLMGNAYYGANWWHFQWERNLIWGQSTFGTELLRYYRLERIKKDFQHWDTVKNFRYGIEWT